MIEELTFWQKLIQDPTFWSVCVFCILFIVRERDFFKGLWNRKITQKEQEHKANLDFESESRKVILDSTEWSKELVKAILEMLNNEQLERKFAVQQLVDNSKATESIVQQSLERMKEFAEIARLQGERHDKRDEEVILALRALETIMSGLWYIMVQGYKVKHSEEASNLIAEMEKKYESKPD